LAKKKQPNMTQM